MHRLFVKIFPILFLLFSCNIETPKSIGLSDLELEMIKEDISSYFLKDYEKFNRSKLSSIESWVFYKDEIIHFAWNKKRICEKGYMPIKLNGYKNEKLFIQDLNKIHLKSDENVYAIFYLSVDAIRFSIKNNGGIILEDTIISRC